MPSPLVWMGFRPVKIPPVQARTLFRFQEGGGDGGETHVRRTMDGRSAGNDDFRETVFGQELAVAGPTGEEALNAAVGEGALDGE